MPAVGPAGRRLPSWIESFIEYTEEIGVPRIFRKWSAIAAIAGALERKVFIKTARGVLYPNMYTILVAPPGVGKTLALSHTEMFWRELRDHHVAPTSLTKASMMDALNDAARRVVTPGQPYMEFNSLLALVGELGVFLPSYENDFMNALTAIYDGYSYSERRRTGDKKMTINSPQLNILAATTPSYLSALLPEGAWDQGFISRTILVYCGQVTLQNPLNAVESSPKLKNDLAHDFKIISELVGRLSFEEDAAAAITRWHMSGGPPTPEHPKLVHYLTRRTAHLLKLCIVACVSRNYGPPTAITLADYSTALDWLVEVEAQMQDIFTSMRSGGDSNVQDEMWHFAYTVYAKEKKPVMEHRLVTFLRERIPSHNVLKVLEIAERSGMLVGTLDQRTGMKSYTPAPKSAY
jgi:hypothetical protein